MATTAPLLSLALCVLLLFHVSVAQLEESQPQQRQFRQQTECAFKNMRALEPDQRFQSEAGLTEYWDQNSKQLQCAGVMVTRQTIEPKGLLLPEYSNAPRLVYIVQGSGVTGEIIPGCPESFHSFRQSEEFERRHPEELKFNDQHQKVRRFTKGDILVMTAGVPHWCYNDGETNVVAVSVLDISSYANQLDQNLRKFHLAGCQQFEREQRQRHQGSNIFNGFDAEILAEAFAVSKETARKLQCQDDRRGNIVRVETMKVVRPPKWYEEGSEDFNGLEESVCNARLRLNIDDPANADMYSPQSGRLTRIDGQKLPMLNNIQMSVERGVLRKNAIFAPSSNMNSHSIVYVTRGNARLQIVGDKGESIFDDQVRQGQVVVIPQYFASMAQAGNQDFEYVSFSTNVNTVTHPFVGKASAFRGIPEEVLMSMYRISKDEARRLKYNRGEEFKLFSPRQQGRPFVGA